MTEASVSPRQARPAPMAPMGLMRGPSRPRPPRPIIHSAPGPFLARPQDARALDAPTTPLAPVRQVHQQQRHIPARAAVDRHGAADHGPRHQPAARPSTRDAKDQEGTDQLSKRARKVLRETLVAGERVLAVVVGRESKFLVLTDRRLLLISGALILRGSDTLQMADLASITSGMLAVAMRMRSGDEYEFTFWPTGTNRSAANDLVRRARELQNAPTPSASPAESAAEQLAKFAQLHQQGLLSDAEFHAQKVRLLG